MNDDRQQRKIHLSKATNNSESKLNYCIFSQASTVVASQPSFSYYTVTSTLIRAYCYDKMYLECYSFDVCPSLSYLKLN
jgi:hypothetical protein